MPFTKQAIRKKYIFFIIVVLVAFAVNQVFLQYELKKHEHFAELINKSGRQRMLSQKLAKLCNVYFFHFRNNDSQNSESVKDEAFAIWSILQTSQRELFMRSSDELADENLMTLLRTNTEKLPQLTSVLNNLFKKESLDTKRAGLKDLTAWETSFLQTMELTVARYQTIAELELNKLQKLQIVLSIFWIAVFLYIFWYTVNPLITSLYKSNNSFIEANNNLLASEEELRANVESLSTLQVKLEKQSLHALEFIKRSAHAVAMVNRKMEYLAVSEKWKTDYDIENKQVIGVSHYKIFPEISKEWKAIHRRCLNGEADSNPEAKFERADGSLQWISWDVRPWYDEHDVIGGIIMSTTDMTQRKLAELEKNRIQNVLADISLAAKIGTWEVNLLDNSVVWSDVTKAIHEVPANYEPGLETGINFYKEGKSRDKIQELVNNCIEYGTPFDSEFELVTDKGNNTWVRSVGQGEFIDGKCIRLYGVFQDVNEKIRKQNSIESNNIELAQITTELTKQNDQLADFVQITSHNLRSPVSNLNSLLHFYNSSENVEDKQEIFEKFEQVVSQLSKTLETLIDALNVSYNKDLPLEKLSFSRISRSVENSISTQIKESGAQITTDFSAVEEVDYNPLYLESIFLNLLTNAIKYKDDKRSLEIKITSERVGERVHLAFTDNGLGIDMKKHADKLFKLNKTFHRNKDAKGIGLFMTKKQIESLGGEISAQSEIDRGSTFTVVI